MGSPEVGESRKKRPFDPESMKLVGYDWPPNMVVKLPAASVVNTRAAPRPLSDCVPMRKISVRVGAAAPPLGTDGSWIITPLLSLANSQTGFCSCRDDGCAMTTQPDDGQL